MKNYEFEIFVKPQRKEFRQKKPKYIKEQTEQKPVIPYARKPKINKTSLEKYYDE